MKHYKTLILACAALGTLTACNGTDSGKPVQWEYKQVAAEGWELVACYDSIETVFPNFGDDKYVTGLQPNVRTSTVFFVFKRPKLDAGSDKKGENSSKNLFPYILLIRHPSYV